MQQRMIRIEPDALLFFGCGSSVTGEWTVVVRSILPEANRLTLPQNRIVNHAPGGIVPTRKLPVQLAHVLPPSTENCT